jgi:hypothetical protein
MSFKSTIEEIALQKAPGQVKNTRKATQKPRTSGLISFSLGTLKAEKTFLDIFLSQGLPSLSGQTLIYQFLRPAF